jgi:hypothetical protein
VGLNSDETPRNKKLKKKKKRGHNSLVKRGSTDKKRLRFDDNDQVKWEEGLASAVR